MPHIGDFNSNYISPVLRKLSKESSEQIFSLSDFNIGLLKYESPELVSSFLDILFSNFLSPQIILPTRISFSPTLIDNTFCNIFCNLTPTTKSMFGNLTYTVTGHLPQFLILPECFSNAPPSKHKSTHMTGKNLMKKNSSLNYFSQNLYHLTM